MKTWGQSASNDATAYRITEAGREDVISREQIVKENGRSKESEKEFVHAEELKGDRRKVFSYTRVGARSRDRHHTVSRVCRVRNPDEG